MTETDPAGNTTAYTYDKAGNRTSMTDPRGNSGRYDGDFTIIYEYDDLNRLVAGYLPKSPGETEKPVVRLVYDARGNLVERIEPDGGRTKYEYTPRNWVKTTTVQGDGKTYVTRHYYDKVGNEIRTVDPRGYETRREYDALSRLVQVIYPAGNREWFEYDENGNRTAYTDGRLNRTEYKYDRYNRLVETRDANGGTTKYFYDRWGNMTRMINPLGHVFRYDYDELDRLIQETDSLGYVKKYRYDAVGNRIYSKDPNGTESIYEYYPNNLVKKISMKNGAEEKTLEYWYDEAGYRRRVRDDDIELVYNTFAGKYIPDPFGRIRRETRNIDGRSFSVDYTTTSWAG